jgi:hypothetical protein
MISRVAVKIWLESILGQLNSDAPHSAEQSDMQLKMLIEDVTRGATPIRNPHGPGFVANADQGYCNVIRVLGQTAYSAFRSGDLARARAAIEKALAGVYS